MQPLGKIIAKVNLVYSFHIKFIKKFALVIDIPDIIKEVEQGVKKNSADQEETPEYTKMLAEGMVEVTWAPHSC